MEIVHMQSAQFLNVLSVTEFSVSQLTFFNEQRTLCAYDVWCQAFLKYSQQISHYPNSLLLDKNEGVIWTTVFQRFRLNGILNFVSLFLFILEL